MCSEALLGELTKAASDWNRQAQFLRVLHVVLVLLGAAGATISAFPKARPSWLKPVGAALAGLTLVILGTLGIQTKADNMRMAWRIMERTIMECKYVGLTNEGAIKNYGTAEWIIGGVGGASQVSPPCAPHIDAQ